MEMAVVDDDELCDHPDPTSLSRSLLPPPSLPHPHPPPPHPPSLSLPPSLSAARGPAAGGRGLCRGPVICNERTRNIKTYPGSFL